MAILLLFTLSCGKAEIGTDIDGKVKLDPTAVEIKLLGPWKITGLIKGSGVDYFNTTMPACEKDNTITYMNGYVNIDEENLKCNVLDAQTTTKKFIIGDFTLQTFAGNKGNLFDVFEILSLNETTLKLKNISYNSNVNDVITYTRQATIRIVNPLTGKWKLTGEVFEGVDLFLLKNGECKISTNGKNNRICALEECEKDDFVVFTEYFTGFSDNGATKCSPADIQVDSFKFKINEGIFALNDIVRTITIIDSGINEYKVISLTATTLKVHLMGSDAGDFQEFTRTP